MEKQENKRICKKCLLKDFDEKKYHEEIEDYIKVLGDDIRTPEDEYRRRLDICLMCDRLLQGTRLKCGCYVEIRAAAVISRCPAKKW